MQVQPGCGVLRVVKDAEEGGGSYLNWFIQLAELQRGLPGVLDGQHPRTFCDQYPIGRRWVRLVPNCPR